MTPGVIAILTKGLTCGVTSACEGGTLLTAGPFQLFCPVKKIDPPVVTPTYPVGGGGGSFVATNNGAYYGVPLHAQPQVSYPNSDEQVLVPFDPKNMGNKIPITVKLKFKNSELEKIYLLDMNKTNILLNVVNLVNSTKLNIVLSVKNLKRTVHNISIKIKSSRYYTKNRNQD